jgi:radical SAM superfamily enzyme YgiQ (UPF0313 family)
MEPLALEYIGAGIKDHHEVKLLDLQIPDIKPGLKETLETFQPDIIACSAFTPGVNSAGKICAEAKKILPGILTVVGGHHATVMPRDYFQDTIDVVVSGEGVFPFKKICECHEKGKSFEDIENIYYRKNGKMVFTRKEEHPPLDSLPFPDRTLTSHLRHRYLTFILEKPTTLANIRGSVGCTYHCKFCAVSSMLKRKVYKHSIDRIIEELATIKESMLLWVDDELLLDSKRAIQLAKEIARAGIKKYHLICGRSDSIIRSPKSLEEWASIGLKLVFIGLESHRDKDLKDMRKGISSSKNEEALRICQANNVQVRGSFIVSQDFDKKDFKNLARYARKTGVDLPSFHVLTPFPGTDLCDEKKGDFIINNYDLYDMAHTILPTKLPLKQFYKEYTKLTKNAIPLRKKIKLFRHIDPKFRKELIASTKKGYKNLKNAYRDYDVVENQST